VIAVRLLRDGVVVRESVFARLPVTVGRGEQCDFVLFDASASRLHGRIERDPEGRLVLRDLESRNGIVVGGTRVPSAVVTGLLRCRFGLAELEVESLEGEVTQEVRVDAWPLVERRRTAGDHLKYLLAAVAGWLVSAAANPELWSPWNKNRAGTLLGHLLAALVVVPMLSFALLVALKAAGRPVRIADTLHASARLAWVWPAFSGLSFISYYVFPSDAHGFFQGLLAVLATAGSLAYAATLRRRPAAGVRMAWAAAIAAILVGIAWTGTLASRRAGSPSLDYHVQVPLAGYPGRTVELTPYLDRVREAARKAARSAEEVRVRQED
jgi:hypothetical protein